MTASVPLPADTIQRQSVHALTIQTVHDAMAAEGWRSILLDVSLDAHRHLVMRQRNQLALVHVEADWDGQRLAPLGKQCLRRLVGEAQHLRAIPLRATLGVTGRFPEEVVSLAQLAKRGRFRFSLPQPFLLEDLLLEGGFDLARYDLEQEIEMSRWELQDLAVQTVRDHLLARGHDIIRSASDDDMDPQIVAMVDGQLTFLLVRAAHWTQEEADFADTDLAALAAETIRFNARSRCVSVSFARAGEDVKPAQRGPLYRGHPVDAAITGLGPKPLRPKWIH